MLFGTDEIFSICRKLLPVTKMAKKHDSVPIHISCNKLVRNNTSCITIHRDPIFSTRFSVMCKVYTGHHGTSETEYGLCTCAVDNPLAQARGLSHAIDLLIVVNSFYTFESPWPNGKER